MNEKAKVAPSLVSVMSPATGNNGSTRAARSSVAPVTAAIPLRYSPTAAHAPAAGKRHGTPVFWRRTSSDTILAIFAAEIRWRGWSHNVVQVGWSILMVLRIACISVAFACVVMFCVSTGDIFSGQSAREQSTREFAVAIMLWANFFQWLCVSSNYAVALISHRFLSDPEAHPKFITCWLKVLRRTYRAAIFSSLLILGVGNALTHAPNSVREYRLHFYVCVLWYHLDMVACNLAANHIFFEETVSGQLRQASQTTRKAPMYWKNFIRIYILTSPNMLSYYATVIYTHVTSTMKLVTSIELLLFTFSSFALKIALQEIAKYNIFKQKVHSVATMAAIVGVPTILIDTQMRIVLLRAPSTSTTLSGTLVMALAEICIRCGKSFHIKHKIAHARVKSEQPSVTSETPSASSGPSLSSTTTATPPVSDLKTEFEIWRLRLLHYHATEVYIDMFAEYVALGCSYVIMFFCWDHPKFQLSRYQESVMKPADSPSPSDNNQTQILEKFMNGSHLLIVIWQLGSEIVVDYLSCLLEIGNGINFQPLQCQAFSLAVLLIWAATGNVAISSNVFLRVGTAP